jgi:hypothetical protein
MFSVLQSGKAVGESRRSNLFSVASRFIEQVWLRAVIDNDLGFMARSLKIADAYR